MVGVPEIRVLYIMIKTKSIYDPASDEDGVRVLVTRYWPRGVSKDRVHLWLKDLSPAPVLIKAYKSGEISWDEFRCAYLEEMDSEARQHALGKAPALIYSSAENLEQKPSNVTLLCTCRDSALCHRSVLRGLISKELKE